MRKNKKILIPLFATVAGLSIVGGVSGAVAWYQYNTRVNASFVGSSVAKSGVLQISRDGTNWHRDVFYKQDDPSFVQDFAPVTFGSDADKVINKNEALPRDGGAHAYTSPEAGVGSYDLWKSVDAGEDYIQFKIYLKALDLNTKPDVTPATDDSEYKAGVHEVYLTELILEGKKQMNNDDANPQYNREIGKALRIHLDVKNGKKFLISQTGSTVNLGDNLDLDGVDGLDRVSNWAWEGQKPLVNYGEKEAVEHSYSVSEIKAVKNANGDMDFGPTSTDEEREAAAAKKEKQLICTTSSSDPVEITVTCWLEGWEKLEGKDKYVKPAAQPSQEDVEADIAREEELKEFYVKDGSEYVRPVAYDAEATYYVRKPASAVWDPRVTGTHQDLQDKYLSQLQVGMTFDVGSSAFKA